MSTPRFIAAFSGHRLLKHPEEVARGLQKAWLRLQERAQVRAGSLELYASIAYGADTLAVETARSKRIPVHLILPKPVVLHEDGTVDQHAGFAADFWTPPQPGQPSSFLARDWDRTYQQIMDAKSGVDGASWRYSRGSQFAPECYYDTGLQTLESCDVLVAVWNGKKAGGLGGTAGMVAHARKLGLPVLIIEADSGAITEERMDQFAAPEDAGCTVIRQIDDFSLDCRQTGSGEAETSDQVFQRLEACSNRESKQFRANLVRIIKLHGGAAFVAAVACILPHTTEFWRATLAVFAFSEFCMVAWALWQTKRLQRNHIHRRWMQTRFAAELVRAMHTTGGLLDPLHPLVARHDATWRRFAITLGLTVHRERRPLKDWRQERDKYVKDRLRNPDMRIGQIKFFTEKQAVAEPHFRHTVKWGSILTHAAVFFVLGSFIYKTVSWLGHESHAPAAVPEVTHASGWSQALFDVAFRLMPIALPLAAGVFISLRSALDSGRRTFRYRELAGFLGEMAIRIEALETEASVQRAVAETEEVLLDELIEWRLAEQQNGAH